MTRVEAIIRPERLDAVRESLYRIGIVGLTVSEVRGSSHSNGPTRRYRGTPYQETFLPRIHLETVVDDDDVDVTLDTVYRYAHTGDAGDGVIFLSRVRDAYRVRTGERGAKALL